MIRNLIALAIALALLCLVGCSGSEPGAGPMPTRTETTAAPGPPPTAKPRPRPEVGACYALEYDDALSPTTHHDPVACRSAHTSLTYAVTTLPELQAGHLLAVDSDRVQQAVADTCRTRFAAYVGAGPQARRLSLLRPVWFTPTLRQADRGANWMRCDVVALSGDSELATLSGDPKGKPGAYGLCGTAQPGTKDFTRVLCRDTHSWRAVSTVDLAGSRYPGEQVARSKASGPCRQAGAAAADDPLDYQWGSEVPTRDQWEAGTTWATCWVPD